MSKNLPSIEDLLKSSKAPQSNQDDKDKDDDENIQVKLAEKEKEIKVKDLERATEKKAASLSLSYINLVGFPISPDALALIKEADAHKIATVCFYYDGKNIKLGTTKPDDTQTKVKIDELKEKYYSDVSLYLISEHSLNYAFEIYKAVPKVKEVAKIVKISEEDLNKYTEKFSTFRDLGNQIAKAQVTDIVTIIMAAAIKSNSSDIHIETEEKDIKVRYRIDGMLHDVATLEKDFWKKIISRMKILANVKINISDKPQDGHISIHTKNENIDIRASFLPTNYGESVVLRILRSSMVALEFEELGIRGKAFEQIKREVERPNGMIVTTGPTGSGKTTTLYAILKKLKKEEAKIITIEDPIEYQLEGINQSQVSENYTFSKALRSIIRQDPDILMVGEIRDLETAEIAIQAALTGHLVLSTIHTNYASGVIPRFLSMGTKPFLLAPAINAIIGQRLVRRICPQCKQKDALNEEELSKVKNILNKLPEDHKSKINFNNLKFYQGGSCEYCQGLGYKGRIGIYEVMIMDEKIEKLILAEKVSEYDIKNIAVLNGMITMMQDGLLKAIDGITSVKEVFRVAEEK